jgi:uncharacterized membrane protein
LHTQEDFSVNSVTLRQTAWIVAWTVVAGLAVYFAAKYASHYYLRYDEASFGRLWASRGAALVHISAGMVALFVPFWQFWSGFRGKPMRTHRLTGRIFLAAVAIAASTSIYVSLTALQPAASFALIVPAAVWLSTAGVAYWAIRNRFVEIHKEWMIRAYVLTFAFVTARLLAELAEAAQFPFNPINRTWASWVVPLFITEVVLQLNRVKAMRTAQERASIRPRGSS